MKVAGTAKKESSEKPGVADIEVKINQAVLRVPECGVCVACTERSARRKLCKNRMEVREKLMSGVFKKVPIVEPAKPKKIKKRKAESMPSPTPKKNSKKGSAATTKGSSNNGGATKKTPKLMMKQPNGQLKPRITSNGNKRMAIPDDLFPLFCRRIGAEGTHERVNLINQFAEEHPTISIRQLTIRFSEITQRDRPSVVPPEEKQPGQGRKFMFYLRPRFYSKLSPSERPEGWEAAAEEDELKWREEKKKAESEKIEKQEKLKDMMDDTDDIDEAAFDSAPPKKKVKVA